MRKIKRKTNHLGRISIKNRRRELMGIIIIIILILIIILIIIIIIIITINNNLNFTIKIHQDNVLKVIFKLKYNQAIIKQILIYLHN